MMTSLVLVAALSGPEILGVSCTASSEGTALKVLVSKPLAGVSMDRFGDELRVSVPASLPSDGVALPAFIAPVQSVAFEPSEASTRLRVHVAAGSTAEAHTEGAVVIITLRGDERDESSKPREVDQLFSSLFPSEPGATPAPETPPSEPSNKEAGGIRLGPLRLSPGLTLRFIDADATYLDIPVPVRTRYFEIDPVLSLESVDPVLGGRLGGSYAPRFRRGANGVPALQDPSHFLNFSYSHPVGTSWQVSVGDSYSVGTIETQVVDPGREYFFDIGRFKRNEVTVGLNTVSDGRLQGALSGTLTKEILPPTSGYFSNDRRSASASLRYELAPERHLSLGYAFEQVPPPPERPVVEMQAHNANLSWEGELTPFLRASLSAGYRIQKNPQAPPGGEQFDGMTFGASLRREFGEGGEISLGASRIPQISAFEANAFYVMTMTQAAVRVPLPVGFQLSAGASYQWNGYRLNATGLDQPRHDELVDWTAGLGRTLSRWAFARVDYQRGRRASNVPGFSVRTYSLTASLGLGLSRGR